jgi:hypothetical protein
MNLEDGIAKEGGYKTIQGNLFVTGNISDVYTKSEAASVQQFNDLETQLTQRVDEAVAEAEAAANTALTTYKVGSTVQKGYGRAIIGGGWQNFTAVVSNGTNWSTSDNDFGQRMVEISPIRVTITPQFSDSLIAIHWNVFGEPSDHNTGFKIAELVSGVPTIIRRSGYEGYNAQFSIVEYNHYIADFYDGDSDTTGRMSNFVYFDKPNSTNERTYTVMFGANGNSANIYTLNRTYNGTGTNDEVGVTTWWWEEIKQ